MLAVFKKVFIDKHWWTMSLVMNWFNENTEKLLYWHKIEVQAVKSDWTLHIDRIVLTRSLLNYSNGWKEKNAVANNDYRSDEKETLLMRLGLNYFDNFARIRHFHQHCKNHTTDECL